MNYTPLIVIALVLTSFIAFVEILILIAKKTGYIWNRDLSKFAFCHLLFDLFTIAVLSVVFCNV